MIDCLKKRECTGCKACGDICPVNAIEYIIDEEGFWYPRIKKEICIGCNKCEQVCPVISLPLQTGNNTSKPKVFAGYSKNREVRYGSTSGGLFTELAEQILLKKGYVIGSEFSDDYKSAVHCAENDRNGLIKLAGTKYFQSDTDGIYRKAEEILKTGKLLLFVGAPCQVAGLYNFLQRDYKNLYTMDFICRGINTPLAYRKYMEELEKRFHSGIKKVRFKDKSLGWTTLATKVTFENGRVLYRDKGDDPWVNAFNIGNIYIRPSCYECRFKGFPRMADISCGDFWGPQWYPEFSKKDNFFGVSVIMVNNDKGAELFDKTAGCMTIWEETLEKAIQGNPAITESPPENDKRKEFFNRLSTEPYSKIVWNLMGLKFPQKQIRFAKVRLKRFVKKHLLLKDVWKGAG